MEKGILFNTEMVQAILEGRKTTTRRIVKLDFKKVYTMACANGKWLESYGETLPEHLKEWYVKEKAKPPYQVGDTLWTKETWQVYQTYDKSVFGFDVLYKSDNLIQPCIFKDTDRYLKFQKFENTKLHPSWNSSLYMPREAARIFLRVTDVRIEKLQDISEEEAKAEGFNSKKDFIDTWNDIYPCWNEKQNPFAWVIEFERVEGR